jgi:hypothetical protein
LRDICHLHVAYCLVAYCNKYISENCVLLPILTPIFKPMPDGRSRLYEYNFDQSISW